MLYYGKIKLAVKNGAFIYKKQLRSYHMLAQTITAYLFIPVFMALPVLIKNNSIHFAFDAGNMGATISKT